MADHVCDWSTITQKWSENGRWLAVILHTAGGTGHEPSYTDGHLIV